MNDKLIISKYKELVEYSYHFMQIDDPDDMKKYRHLESELFLLQEQEKEPENKCLTCKYWTTEGTGYCKNVTLCWDYAQYEPIPLDQSGIREECEHPYAFVYRKGDYEKCSKCGKVLCEG